MGLRRLLQAASRLVLYCSPLIAISAAQETSNGTSPKAVQDFLFFLAQNDVYQPPTWRAYFGGQNFTWCCTKAVADSLYLNPEDNSSLAVYDNAPAPDIDPGAVQSGWEEGMFPCTASYSGQFPNGSPEINVNYTWLWDTCPGWKLNDMNNLNAWLQPLSGFLLPAVIFCLSVPRRRKIHVPRNFFVADLAGIKSYVPAFLGAIASIVIVSLDTLLWLAICFALAGPMILSGLYEALLDSRVTEFVRDKMQNRNLTLDMRCRLLMVVLIGNLDLAVEHDPLLVHMRRRFSQHWKSRLPIIMGTKPVTDAVPLNHVGTSSKPTTPLSQNISHPRSEDSARLATGRYIGALAAHLGGERSSLEDQITRRGDNMGPELTSSGISKAPSLTATEHTASPRSRTPDIRRDQTEVDEQKVQEIQRQDAADCLPSPWRHMEELLWPIRLFDDDDTTRQLSPRQYPRVQHDYSGVCAAGVDCRNPAHLRPEPPRHRTPHIKRQVGKTKTRLRSMLNCQYSFGSMVGAPVLFFLGGFVFALLQSLASLGNEDIALALAFGQFYMIIPHISIVSGLLLAGNNPNILEGVFATQPQSDPKERPMKLLGLEFGLAYPSCYKVAWQWHRGHNKKRWINLLIDTYAQPDQHTTRPLDTQKDHLEDLRSLREKTRAQPLDWFLIVSLTMLLLGVPFVLALLTAYYTPEVGVSCRSFTFVTYEASQLGQMILWFWAHAGHPDSEVVAGSSTLFRPFDVFRRNGWLDRHGFYEPKSRGRLRGSDRTHSVPSTVESSEVYLIFPYIWYSIWYLFYFLFAFMATMSAIGGTLMQILGVYSSDICNLTTNYWMNPLQPGLMVLVSANSKEMIRNAQIYWEPCAVTAISFMSVVSFVGWWYQRRMRDLFTEQVNNLDKDEYDRADAREAKQRGDFAGDGVFA